MRLDRYARQMAVPGFGREAQERLRAAMVAVIGAGGLAAPVLQYLVGAGVGRIRLVDPETVDLSNLHRQTLFREADDGAPKAEVAARRLAGLNAETSVEPCVERFDPANAERLCAAADLVLDCADSFAASYIASDHCLGAGTHLVSASVVGTAGYCGGYCKDAPGLRAVFPDLPDRLGSCAADGVLGPSVGVIGALQAQMALALLTGARPSPAGQLVTYEATKLRFGEFRFDGAENPVPSPRFIATREIGASDVVVDLRDPGEPGPRLPGAARLDLSDIEENRLDPGEGGRVVLACRSGLRAWKGAEALSRNWSGDVVLLALGDA